MIEQVLTGAVAGGTCNVQITSIPAGADIYVENNGTSWTRRVSTLGKVPSARPHRVSVNYAPTSGTWSSSSTPPARRRRKSSTAPPYLLDAHDAPIPERHRSARVLRWP